MFQTKVKQEYVQQVQTKDFQTQWLEQALSELTNSCIEYESVKYSENLALIVNAIVKVLETLRNDILDPQQYDRLSNQVQDFLAKIYEFFKACCTEQSPLKVKIDPTRLYNDLSLVSKIVPRLYLLTVAGRILHEDFQSQIQSLEANKKKTKAQKLDILELQNRQLAILTDISSQAHGIQNPTILIFFRNYLSNTFSSQAAFVYDNCTEMSRFYARTQYDPARTAAEARRRDSKRSFLGQIISNKYSSLLIITNNEEIFMKVLTFLTNSNDLLAVSQIWNVIIQQMPTNLLRKNLKLLLSQITQNIIGTGAFLQVIEKLQDTIVESEFDDICEAGMSLAKQIVDVLYEKGETYLNEQLQQGGGVKQNISPWISILSYLMQIGSRLWPDDLGKISFAFDLIIQVIYPDLDQYINEVALGINKNAICFVSDVDFQSDKVRKMTLDDFSKKRLTDNDLKSIVSLMVGPIQELDESLIIPFIMLAPMVILRESIDLDQKNQFCQQLAEQLVQRPLIDEEFQSQKEAHETQGENVINTIISLINYDSYLFAQTLHSIHGSTALYQMIINNKVILEQEAQQNIIPALFYTLIRDDYIQEAILSLSFLDSQNTQQIVYLNLSAAKLAQNQKQDSFNFIRAAFESYETCAISTQQSQLFSIIINSLMTINFKEEKDCILQRTVACALNLMQREQRCVALARTVLLYKHLGVDASELEDQCLALSNKFASSSETQEMNLLLGKVTIEELLQCEEETEESEVEEEIHEEYEEIEEVEEVDVEEVCEIEEVIEEVEEEVSE